MGKNKSAKGVIVDESVSDSNLMRFKRFAEEKGLKITGYQLIREMYPGVPDGQILYHLLNDATIFITTDRPLHNTVLSRGWESYYLGEKTITGKHLRGIQLKADMGINKKDRNLQASYLPIKTEIRSLLLPDSPQKLKKLHTKRRRIRNYFDGLDHMEEVAVTVSWQLLGSQVLIGVRIQVSSNVGLKALGASESYMAEALPPEYCGIGSLSYALVLVIQLMLNSIKTVVYYDSARIDKSTFPTTAWDGLPYQVFFERLSESFKHLEFVPVSKGRHIETLRQKLAQLVSCQKTNEIQQDNLKVILSKFVATAKTFNCIACPALTN